MQTILRTVLLLLFFAVAGTVPAQTSLALPLDSAVDYAVRHNRTLINSRYAVDRMTQRVREAVAAGLPQINASVDYTNFLGAEATLKLGENAPPATIAFNPTSNLKAGVTQLVFSGSYIVGLQIAKLSKQLTEESYRKDEADVKEMAIQAYYLVLANERILSIIRQNRDNIALIREKTVHLAEAGILEETDAKKLQITVTNIENQIRATERQLETAYNLLRLQLGLEPGQPVSLTSTLDDLADRFLFRAAPADTFRLGDNLSYKLVLMQGEVAQKTVRLRQSSYLPTLAGFYSYTEKLKKPLFDMSPKHAVGLTLSIPLFSGGQRLAQVKQARIDMDVSENTRALLAQQLTLQERQLRYNFQNLFDQYHNQKTATDLAREVFEKMEHKYRQGIISTLELTSSNAEYLNAETAFAGVLLQLMNAELALRKTNNKL